MTPATRPTSSYAPALRAVDLWTSGIPRAGEMKQLLSDAERSRLATIASLTRFKKGAVIYRAGETADAVLNIVSGVVKAYRLGADSREHITAFLFPGDVFGLSVEGLYANSTKAITPLTAYQLPVSALQSRLLNDAGLEFRVICKLCHELRETQRHAFLLSQHRALTKVAMFLQMLEQLQAARGEPSAEIYLPMARAEIGEYVGMTAAAVSRGFRTLAKRGVIRTRDLRHVKIIDRTSFEKLAASYGPS
jgi:CRP-like cAMP-binding protein